MFAKIVNRVGDAETIKYVVDVSDVEVQSGDVYFVKTLENEGYVHIPDNGANEVAGHTLLVQKTDGEVVKAFCNDVIYLCNDQGRTVDRIPCKVIRNV